MILSEGERALSGIRSYITVSDSNAPATAISLNVLATYYPETLNALTNSILNGSSDERIIWERLFQYRMIGVHSFSNDDLYPTSYNVHYQRYVLGIPLYLSSPQFAIYDALSFVDTVASWAKTLTERYSLGNDATLNACFLISAIALATKRNVDTFEYDREDIMFIANNIKDVTPYFGDIVRADIISHEYVASLITTPRAIVNGIL